MNSLRKVSRNRLLRPFEFRQPVLLATAVLLSAFPASAAEFTFQYYRFKPTKLNNNGSAIQLSEFTFSRAGVLLNLNNRDGSGVNPVPVTASSSGQGSGGNEDPPKVVDGLPFVNGGTATKWFRGGALVDGNELVFNFGTGVTVDAYNFATGNDSAGGDRTPVSWRLAGSNDGINWSVLDVRNDMNTTTANNTYQVGYAIPSDVPPVINSFTVAPGVVLNNSLVNFTWSTQFSATRTLVEGTNSTNLAAEFGSLAVTPPSNATTAYTLVAAKPGSVDATSGMTVRTVKGGSSSYRYVRYAITKRRGTGSNMVQVTEFEFYNTAVSPFKIPVAAISNPGGSNTDPSGGEYVSKLVDGSNASKWLDGNNKPVIFDFGSQVSFNSYGFVTGNDDAGRDPVNWTLEGSNNALDWTLIENIDFDYPTPIARIVSSQVIPLPGASLPAKIDIFTGNTSTLIAGETLTLTYATRLTTSVTISPDPGGTLPLSGTLNVSPATNTTYTLSAFSADNTAPPVTATFSVVVIPDPGVPNIEYSNFASAGAELAIGGTASITPPTGTLPGRLRLTPELGGQLGSAWFLKKLNSAAGFEANFGLHMNQENPNNNIPADGLAFVVQNSISGTNNPGTGEDGVSENSLNICFHSFGFGADPASVVEIRSGTTVITRTVTFGKPGVELHGVPAVDAEGNVLPTGGTPYTLGSLASDPPYRIRVVYTPNNLDVYLDGIAIIQNAEVDLGAIGAADAGGKSYFGFTGRTGGNVQNNDITDWQVKLGDFSALPPFGIVKTLFKYTAGNPKPTSVDMVWNASAAPTYEVVNSLNLQTWSPMGIQPGVDGQIGVTIDLPFSVGDVPAEFFRIEEHIAD